MSIAPDTRTAIRPQTPVLAPADLEKWLIDRVAFHLHRPAREIDPTTPLADYGIDSVAAIGICGEIEERHLLAVPPTLAYDFPTVRAIAGHLAELLAVGETGGAS
ncbi:acyl carrier protein [Streptomyces sp. TLI_146]|uniref:acyl carrier protein n=1 Tax=Streptomyces sp. TLI_146 TaxID=1938858 RepID=UPI000C70A68C|nr:acyl carrier protein [Streptomyces sp. TLI_146]PKV83834.1 acyl carrier protein [Streptomyces sp. TLI_146]